MKEIIIRLVDEIADPIIEEAKRKGITPEELCKYILGSFVQYGLLTTKQQIDDMTKRMSDAFRELEEVANHNLTSIDKKLLIRRAQEGSLACKNCTMKISVEDVDIGKCGSCGAPL